MARGLKFRIEKVERLFYLSSKNKGSDQLCSYCATDPQLSFHICKSQVFSRRCSFYLSCSIMRKSEFANNECIDQPAHLLSLISAFSYPATLKSVGYYVVPSVQKFAFEGPSIHPSICPSVSALFQLSARCIF